MSLLSRLRETWERRANRESEVSDEPEGFRFTRRLPGKAQRTATGEVDFRFGHVILAEDWRQYMEIQHPEQRFIFAIGSNYMYWCDRCKATVYEEEITKLNPIVWGGPRLTSLIRCCPFCATWGPDGKVQDGLPLSPVKVGTRVRAHYRYMPDGSSANWWAERWGG